MNALHRIRQAGAALAAVAGLAAGTPAWASRIVIVNGALMSPQSLERLDRAACARIPDGSYWLNLTTGAWGHVGNPAVQGYFGDQCHGGRNPDDTYGPYATQRRAEEVANGYRSRGLWAVVFHNGDGYYFRVQR